MSLHPKDAQYFARDLRLPRFRDMQEMSATRYTRPRIPIESANYPGHAWYREKEKKKDDLNYLAREWFRTKEKEGNLSTLGNHWFREKENKHDLNYLANEWLRTKEKKKKNDPNLLGFTSFTIKPWY